MVSEFKETMPIVTALGNRNLKEYHWEEIEEILKEEIEKKFKGEADEFNMQDKNFALGTLIELNVANYQEELQMVSTTASQEANLRGQIDEVSRIWSELEFNIKSHREGEYHILGDLEDV